MHDIKHFNAAVTPPWPVQVDEKGVETRVEVVNVIKQQKNYIRRISETLQSARYQAADKTTPCRRKSVCVKKVVEAVKKGISRNPRRSRISPVLLLVPPPSRQVSGSSARPRAEISEFVNVVIIGIHFQNTLKFEVDMFIIHFYIFLFFKFKTNFK